MHWDAIIGISEMIGAAAIVVSLVYVAIQIKQNSNLIERNNELSAAQAFHFTNTQYSAVFSQLSADADLARIYRRAIEGEILDEDEAIRFVAFVNTFFSWLEDVHIQSKAALYDMSEEGGDVVKHTAPYFTKLLKSESARVWWDQDARHLYGPGFHAVVSRHMAKEDPEIE